LDVYFIVIIAHSQDKGNKAPARPDLVGQVIAKAQASGDKQRGGGEQRGEGAGEWEGGWDIEIVFTGRRPGEKLCEELFRQGERVRVTKHEHIFIA